MTGTGDQAGLWCPSCVSHVLRTLVHVTSECDPANTWLYVRPSGAAYFRLRPRPIRGEPFQGAEERSSSLTDQPRPFIVVLMRFRNERALRRRLPEH